MQRDKKPKLQFSHVAIRNLRCSHHVQINNDMILFQLHCHTLTKYHGFAQACVVTATARICDPLL